MGSSFSTLDAIVFCLYAALILFVGLFVSRTKKGEKKNSQDYFLASKSLPWWAIGASIIASNISAEQFIGMSGSGFAIGMAVASYEFLAAATLIVVAVVFLPIYLRSNIYTMPQFLEIRYDKRVKTIMAIFWLLVFIFINLTSILYLGSLAINKIVGVDMLTSIILIAAFSALYSIYGGLKAVAITDLIQVIFLIGGGLITTYIALNVYSDGAGVIAGFQQLLESVPEKFDMILDVSDPNYEYLPGIGVLLGGLWVSAFYYFGCNQYIIQRALAAKSIREAQLGLVFAAFLKLILPLIVVIPGIIAFALDAQIDKPDQSYPWLMHEFVPSGIKGIAFAALVAAIVSSLASMINSISTIFTMDIYREIKRGEVSESRLVNVGRIFGLVALLISIVIAPLLGNLDQAFQFIQEFTGFVSPGALAIFVVGFFWKRANANGAIAAAIATFLFSSLFLFLLPEVSFLDRMGYVFLICIAIMTIFGLTSKETNYEKAINIDKTLFRTSRLFKVLSCVVIAILSVIYYIFW